MLSVCADRVRQLSDFSHETSRRDSSPLGSTASAQINHGWLQRRTKRPFQALSHEPQSLPNCPLFPLLWPPFESHFGSRVDAKRGRCACVRVNGMRCWDKRKEAKPLRQVHRKVLRNWQVNCAMHAWAMPLGERGAQDLSITTFWSTPAPHFTMSTLLQTLEERMPTAGKIAKPLFFFFFYRHFDPPQIRQWLLLTLTYLVVLDPFRCRINLRKDKPFLYQNSSPGCCCCCCLCA